MEKTIENITTIERIAMQKTAMQKTAMEKTSIEKITAKITTTALLFFLALFTLTTNLKAQAVQENSKSGFFAGFVVLDGFQVDSTKSITTSETTSYRVTGYANEINGIRADAAAVFDATAAGRPIVLSPGIEALFKESCQTNANVVSVGGIDYTFVVSFLNSFDAGTATGESSPVTTTADNPYTITESINYQEFPSGFNTQHITGYQSYCYQYFYGGLAAERTPLFSEYEVTPDSGTPPQVSAESDKLSGVGLQFGYRWEKWRASFTHYTGQGGDHEFTNSLVMADYFFSGEFFVGAGIASMQLTNSSAGSSTSASATSPVLQVGYTENLTKNLQLSIGVLQYSSGVSLSHSSTSATNSLQETQTVDGDSAVIGASIGYSASLVINTFYFENSSTGAFIEDLRTVVTQEGTRTVNIEEIVTPAGGGTVEAEIKAPTVISITLQLSF